VMELRIKVFCLATEDTTHVLTCNERYNALRVRLEEFGVVDVSAFCPLRLKRRNKNAHNGF
jgi:hypothetical protein